MTTHTTTTTKMPADPEKDNDDKEDEKSDKIDDQSKAKEAVSKEALPELKKGEVIVATGGSKYKIVAKVGEGSFGGIYKCTEEDKPKEYAMKIEARNAQYPVLKLEIGVLKSLKEANAKHATTLFARGRQEKFNFIVMTLLDNSITGLMLQRHKNAFSICTAIRVGMQMLTAIKELHGIGFLHRDLKPANFAVAKVEEQQTVFMIDYGMCRKYRKPNGGVRFPRATAEFRGTTNYAPLSAHTSTEQSRKDEIEAWLYIMLEMIHGKLPWATASGHNEHRKQKLEARLPSSALSQQLFAGNAKELRDIMDKVDKWQYVDEPDYGWLAQVLTKIHAVGCTPLSANCKKPFDWCTREDQSYTHQDTTTTKLRPRGRAVTASRRSGDDKGTVKGDKGTVKRDKGTVKGDKGTVKGDKGTVKGDKGTVKGDKGTVKGDKGTVKGDKGTVKGDKGTVKGDKDAVKGNKGSAKVETTDKAKKKGHEQDSAKDKTDKAKKKGHDKDSAKDKTDKAKKRGHDKK